MSGGLCAKSCGVRIPAEVSSTSRHEKQMEIAWVHLSYRALSAPAATAGGKKGPREKHSVCPGFELVHWPSTLKPVMYSY